jgi:site-specific recombinase XerD
MQSNKSCPIIEQYLAYLITVKGRSQNTISEYRLDLLQFFCYIADSRGHKHSDFSFADLDFIRSICLGDMYAFLAYCQETLNAAPGTRYRKIVSIRQFWKYLKTKVRLIDNNIAEELETLTCPQKPSR